MESDVFKNICWVNRLFIIMIALLSIISISALLGGCGNKGALYLPNDKNRANQTNVVQADAVIPVKK